MRDYGFELEPIVIQSIMKLDELFSNGLIQNTESIGFENAKKYDKLIMLRWRKRECILCNSSFDITSEGLLYKCGECLNEKN